MRIWIANELQFQRRKFLITCTADEALIARILLVDEYFLCAIKLSVVLPTTVAGAGGIELKRDARAFHGSKPCA
jgi:hypothetical protein